MTILLITLLICTALLLIANGTIIFLFLVNRNSIKRIMSFGEGLVDIQARLKSMIFEHHDLMNETLNNVEKNIIRHVTYTNRWQKVMAKMIRVGNVTPMEKATGSETIAEAEELHEIGLDIAKVAFEDKQELEESKPTDQK